MSKKLVNASISSAPKLCQSLTMNRVHTVKSQCASECLWQPRSESNRFPRTTWLLSHVAITSVSWFDECNHSAAAPTPTNTQAPESAHGFQAPWLITDRHLFASVPTPTNTPPLTLVRHLSRAADRRWTPPRSGAHFRERSIVEVAARAPTSTIERPPSEHSPPL
jgi:hypothetical protein